LSSAIEQFVKLYSEMDLAYSYLADEEKIIQRHEDLIADPQTHFVRMFEFLGVDPLQQVIDACANKIWQKPNKTRDKINWSENDLIKCSPKRLFEFYADSLNVNEFQK